LSETRWHHWYQVSRQDRWAMLGGQLVTSALHSRPPFWVWNRAMNQLYMSSYHLAPDLVPYYLEALKRFRIQYLWGYTSALHVLAQEVLRIGRNDLKLKVAITNAEPIYAHQRKEIGEAFQCPVRETYGMSEMVAAASECQCGHLHVWPEAGRLEIWHEAAKGADGLCGDLLCTGLLNADMPLIRYRVGDRVTGPIEFSSCECGCRLPILGGIEGRTDDVLFTADGRRIGRLDPVFKSHLSVREAQIEQETLERIRVRYVPAPGFTSTDAKSIVARLQARLGPVQVVLEPVPQVPRTANGKFRAVICSLPARLKNDLLTGKTLSCRH
jgi:phenylacetate-CoA ligase